MRRQMEESRRIKVYLNGKPVHIFRGMKVKHILSLETLQEIKSGESIITDEEGNERGLEGSLSDGEKLHIGKRQNIT